MFIWATYATGRDGFWISLWLLWGKVTVLPRLLVVGQLLWLVIPVFEECLELHGGVLLFIVGCWLLCDCYVWSYCFRRMSRTSRGCVTPCCRLLVIVRLLHLVVLFFDSALFVLFEVLLVVCAICMTSRYGFLPVNFAVGVIL